MAERDFLEKEIKYHPTPIDITQNSFQNATKFSFHFNTKRRLFQFSFLEKFRFRWSSIGVESGTNLFLTLSPFLK